MKRTLMLFGLMLSLNIFSEELTHSFDNTQASEITEAFNSENLRKGIFQEIEYRIQTEDSDNVSRRILSIQQSLELSQNRLDFWWYGWLTTYGAATIGQGIVGLSSSDLSLRQDMLLGAGTTLLGAAFQLITPLSTRTMVHELAAMPANTDEEKKLKLLAAERFFAEIARKEKEGRSWQIHALNTAVNLGSGLITWLGFKRTVWDGVSNFLLNTVITETQIWTQPTRALKAYEKYSKLYIENDGILKKRSLTEINLKASPSSVSLAIRF